MVEAHVTGTFPGAARRARQFEELRRRGHDRGFVRLRTRAFPDCGGYTAAKAGQLGLARVLAEEARPLDVRVTTLMPGATDTPIWDDRPGFDRTKMMRPADVAEFLLAIVTRPSISVEEVVLTPPSGAL